jgi:hypothetical protein
MITIKPGADRPSPLPGAPHRMWRYLAVAQRAIDALHRQPLSNGAR